MLLDTQAGTEDPDAVPLYRGMIDDWVANGPSDEVAEISASLIIGDPDLGRCGSPGGRPDPRRCWPVRATPCWSARASPTGWGRSPRPALVVHGTADVAITMDKAEALAAGLSGCAGVVTVEGGTHAANMTHPGPVNEAVLAFLDGLPD